MMARPSMPGRGIFPTTTSLAALVLFLTACSPDPIDRITEDDLRADLFALSGDETRGREGGTLDEMSASVWLAQRAEEIGLEPAGDDGTYFQFFPLERTRVSSGSLVALGGTALRLGEDVVPGTTVPSDLDVAGFVASNVSPEALSGTDLAGRALIVRYPANSEDDTPSLRAWMRGLQRVVTASPPAALVIVVPAGEDEEWDRVAFRFPRGSYGLDPEGTGDIEGPPSGPPTGGPLLYVREAALSQPLRSGVRLRANLVVESFQYPSVNVVGRVPGTDPTLASEHVLFSAHQDHDGVRYTVDGDSIWNGADDNATTSVALLAIGRAFVARPGQRSALFIWHGSEERGLMGSRWYVKNPTVPLESIVAALNGDMMGRNHPDTAALLGAVPPHRNSEPLVQMALEANEETSGFVLDHSWDDPEHREGWYYRSDHLPYARSGVPALFFTTLLHEDYHTPFDNPDRIDVAKLTRMTRWMYATGRAVAEAGGRPTVDAGFELERCRDWTGDYCGG
jgi:hypothetical protein